MFDRRQLINLAAALLCIGMILWAIFYAVGVLKLEPCPLCMFQRVLVGMMGVIFLVAALHPAGRIGAAIYGVLIFIAAGATSWVAGRHVWIQMQPPGTVPACGAPLDALMQMFPIFEVVRKVMTGGGECAKVDWTLFGVSMPGWVLIVAVSLGIVGVLNNIVYGQSRTGARR